MMRLLRQQWIRKHYIQTDRKTGQEKHGKYTRKTRQHANKATYLTKESKQREIASDFNNFENQIQSLVLLDRW